MLKLAIVNDSPMAVESLRRIVGDAPGYRLAWVAFDGAEAIEKCHQERPDIVLMDLIMPGMDGVATTRRIVPEFGCAVLIVTASVDRHTGKVFEAMGAGALDAVNTPVLGAGGDAGGDVLLLHKIDTIATLLQDRNAATVDAPRQPASPPLRGDRTAPLIAIGASTGGPAALARLLGGLPAHPAVAIAIVQHVDEQFCASFTHWLDQQSPVPVRMARAGERPQAGEVVVCGREHHLVLTPAGCFDYVREPTTTAYRPSVDVFFHSLANNHDNHGVGVLLTGMGRDGAAGLKAMRARGWLTLAQDRHSCAVYGMPKAARELDAADKILPLEDIGTTLLQWAEDPLGAARTRRKSG